MDLDHAQFELKVHSRMDNPNIIPLIAGEETTESIIIITPLAIGDLYSLTQNKVLTERNCRNLTIQLLNGLQYLHETIGVVHCDIKPQNILLFRVSEGKEGQGEYVAKICDFGFSESLVFGQNITYPGLKGSLGYFSPEQLRRQPISHAVDIFALGVIVYQLLCGYEPFYPTNRAGYLTGDWDNNDSNILKFDSPYWDKITPEAIEFVRGCLDGNPSNRWTAGTCLKSQWISTPGKKLVLPLSPRNVTTEDSNIQFANVVGGKNFI